MACALLLLRRRLLHAGEEFLYSPDGFSMTTEMAGASLSKWPAAVMISGLVNDGTMAFTDKANKYLDFWATDPADTRSNVTLESLLSFTSGYTTDAAGVYECVCWNSWGKGRRRAH